MLSVEEAQSLVLSRFTTLGAQTVPLSQALGRVLAEPAVAQLDNPPADVSAMDGWAVRAADGASLTQIGESSAGHPFKGRVGPGQCVRIFTGAQMPDGADSVIMQEEVAAQGQAITLNAPATLGRHVRKQGQDFSRGGTVLAEGRLLGGRHIGLLAAMNLPWVTVVHRPRVAILSTGDELALPGQPIPESGLISSNGPMLAAMVRECGGEVVDLGIARDDFDSLAGKAKEAFGCDLLVTSGGVSVGAYDKVKDALASLGFSAEFHKIAMKPGKPLMFGQMGQLPVLGLPGNPVSAFVCAILFLRPCLRRMQSQHPLMPAPVEAELGASLDKGGERQEYLRARIQYQTNGSLRVYPFQAQDSAMLSELGQSDALILRPIKAPAAQAGDHVSVLLLD